MFAAGMQQVNAVVNGWDWRTNQAAGVLKNRAAKNPGFGKERTGINLQLRWQM
jgi:hypothetical protein